MARAMGGGPGRENSKDNERSARLAYLFCASFSWREQNKRERPGRPAQGELYLRENGE